jgi:hypothetical protein
MDANIQQGEQPQQGAQQQQPILQVNVPPANPQPIVKKSLSKWGIRGLDLTDAGFSKLHDKESKFDASKETHYNLEPEKFEEYKQKLIQKVNRMHALNCMSATDDNGNACEILKEYTQLTRDNIEQAAEIRWPNLDPVFAHQEEADDYTDEQLKASTIGNWIHESLTEFAKKQLRAEQEFFECLDADGNPYFDGPSYFYAIAELVDPDNGQLIETVRTQLRELDVKDFGYSVIQMLAEFKNLQTRIGELGGTYDVDDQFLDFWACLRTMKEKEFARYVKQERDAYRKLARGNRGRVETYMRDMCDKEVAMKADKEWNVMSPEDAMVMSLVTALELATVSKKSGQKKKNPPKDSIDKKREEVNSADVNTEKKRRDDRIPDWKKDPPKDNSTTKEMNDKTYHWCGKCRDGKGQWALHKESDHRIFKKKSEDDKATANKKVSFKAALTGEEDSDDQSTSSQEPKIQVSQSILKNAKAYLAQFQDFPKGGSSEEA